MKVDTFIKKASMLYRASIGQKFTVVMGNQSGDLDSIVSAVCLSYHLDSKSPETRVVPFLNIKRSVLSTKRECCFLLDQFALSQEDFLYLDQDWSADKVDSVVLVDHNQLDDKQKELGLVNLVSGVIDHHLDSGDFKEASPRVVDIRVGSNATLITQILKESASQELDESIANMLLFPILSDTSNLTTRTSDMDREAVAYLKSRATLDPVQLYKRIEEFKFATDDNEDMSVSLKKDYKQYETNSFKWGMSSVVFSLEARITSKPSDLSQIGQFMRDNELRFFGMLSCYKADNEFKRDLALFSFEGEEVLTNYKDNESVFEYGKRAELESGSSLFCVVYKVKDIKSTRKYFQPSLESYLKQAF